ncbi:MAG: anaerobic C4-dicarboxylate transporter, partial [Campylobacteraceae bacterium]|nr:anaerobic C4-dicarboxylate transporter [Campylobacteraceae bacterium]
MEFLTNLSEGTQFAIQLLVVLVCLFYGARKGGIALGLLGGIGLLVLVFAFNVKPGAPSTAVIFTILAVVVASATLQASGGLDVMLQIAEKLLRKNPRYLTILAPFVSCFLTILCGTGHVVYTLLPIVYDIAIKNGIRPERPMAATSVSAQMGIIASPVSVAVVSLTAMLVVAESKIAGFDGYLDLLKITIPSTLFGVLSIGIFSWFRGKDLDKDEEFQEKLKDPEFKKYVYGDGVTLIGKKLPANQWAAMWIFLGAIAIVALLGYFAELRPSWPDAKGAMKPLDMVQTIQMFMLIAGALIVIFTKMDANKISKNEIFRSGMIAMVAVFGISWMADSMFAVHTPMMKAALGEIVREHSWTYAVMLLLVSKFVNSQAAALAAFVPLALGIGVSPGIIVAFAAACYGYYILPTYPSDLAAIQFDRSGTTKIGKYVINHSFIIPGFLGVITS